MFACIVVGHITLTVHFNAATVAFDRDNVKEFLARNFDLVLNILKTRNAKLYNRIPSTCKTVNLFPSSFKICYTQMEILVAEYNLNTAVVALNGQITSLVPLIDLEFSLKFI